MRLEQVTILIVQRSVKVKKSNLVVTLVGLLVFILASNVPAQDKQENPCEGKAVVFVYSSKAEGTVGRVV